MFEIHWMTTITEHHRMSMDMRPSDDDDLLDLLSNEEGTGTLSSEMVEDRTVTGIVEVTL